MIELNYKTFGQGYPVIILHGLFGALDNWQTIARQLADHFTVYIPDQRNHGRSPHIDEMNYMVLADDLRHFMESHWIYKAHIIGHSMGGKTAMQFALDHGDMVDKLIVVDIAPKAYPGGHEEIFAALTSLDLQAIDSRQQAEVLLKRRIPDQGTLQFLMKNLSRDKDGRFEWKMNLKALYRHYPEILSAVSGTHPFEGPTLFIRGERSPYIQDEDMAAARQLFPQARLSTVTGAGHWVHADQPKVLLDLLKYELV